MDSATLARIDRNLAKMQQMGASKDEMQAYLSSEQQIKQPAASDTMDLAKAIGGGIQKGVAGTAMMLPNLLNEAVAGPQYLYEGIIGQDRPDFEPYRPFFSSNEALGMLPESIQPYEAKTPYGQAAQVVSELGTSLVAPSAMQKTANKAFGSEFYKSQTSVPSAAKKQYTSAELRDMSSAKFTEAEKLGGGQYNSGIIDRALSRINKTVSQTPEARAVAGDTPATQYMSRLESLRGKPLSLTAAREIDQDLTRAINSHIDPLTGIVKQDGMDLMNVQTALRETLEKASVRDLMPLQFKTPKDLSLAKNELDSLKTLEKTLIKSVETSTKSGDVTLAANEAKSLSNVRQQIKAQQDVIGSIKADIAKFPSDAARAAASQKAIEATKEARKLWSASARMQDLQNIVERASSTQNPANSIKAGFRALLANKKRMRGYSQQERDLIKKAANSGVVGDLMNTMGSRLGSIITMGAGGSPASVLGTAALNTAARGGASSMQSARAGKVAQSVAQRATGQLPAPYQSPYTQIAPESYGLLGFDAQLLNNQGLLNE